MTQSASGGGAVSVSVVIPAYNRAEELESLVRSVLSHQRYPVAEVILVDDGSTDHTPLVARSLPEPVRYIRQANTGVSGARNRGLSEATGDLVALLDTDDRWEPEKLELQVGVMSCFPQAGWSATDIRLVRSSDPTRTLGGIERAVPVFREQRRSPVDWFASRLDPCRCTVGGATTEVFVGDAFGLLLHGNFIFPSTVMIRRSVIEEAGMFDPGFPRAEETEYFLRVAAVSPLAMIPLPLTSYRTGDEDALTAAKHTVELTALALKAVDQAIAQRQSPSDFERRSAASGRRAILLRQAYAHLSQAEPGDARQALDRVKAMNLGLGARGHTILALSLLPPSVLKALARGKRLLRKVFGS